MVEIRHNKYPKDATKRDIKIAIFSLVNIIVKGLYKSFNIKAMTKQANKGFIKHSLMPSLILNFLFTLITFNIITTKKPIFEPIIAPFILKTGLGINNRFPHNLIPIPKRLYKNGSIIFPDACKITVNNWDTHTNIRHGESHISIEDEAVFENKSSSNCSPNINITVDAGSATSIVRLFAVRIVFSINLLLFSASAPVIRGRTLIPREAIIPVGK